MPFCPVCWVWELLPAELVADASCGAGSLQGGGWAQLLRLAAASTRVPGAALYVPAHDHDIVLFT